MKPTLPINSKFLFSALATLALYNAMPSSAAAAKAGLEKQAYLSSRSIQDTTDVQHSASDRIFIRNHAGQEKQVYLSTRGIENSTANQKPSSPGRNFITSRSGQEKQTYLSSVAM